MSEWISVKDRMPKDDETVLCYDKRRTTDIPVAAYYVKELNGFVMIDTLQNIVIDPSHWMPLPNPPEMKDDATT
jgi:hypothetical protein